MKISILIKSLAHISLKELQKINELGLPIMVFAHELQQNSEVDEILGKLNLNILSYDVDDDKHGLQVAWESCVNMGWSHFIVIDKVNENILSCLETMIKQTKKYPEKLGILCPPQEREDKGLGFIAKAILGQASYAHYKSEVCCYPVSRLKNINLKKSTKYAHLKILVNLLWNKVQVFEIPYLEKEVLVPFNFKNKLIKIYYDTLLLALANLQQGAQPKVAAISCAIGVFIACTPFYGLQSIILFFICLIFRLNFPIAFVGSQLSLPPIYALILPLELIVGFKVLDKPVEYSGDWVLMAQNHFSSLLVGSIIVGGLLSIASGLIWFYLQRINQIKV